MKLKKVLKKITPILMFAGSTILVGVFYRGVRDRFKLEEQENKLLNLVGLKEKSFLSSLNPF